MLAKFWRVKIFREYNMLMFQRKSLWELGNAGSKMCWGFGARCLHWGWWVDWPVPRDTPGAFPPYACSLGVWTCLLTGVLRMKSCLLMRWEGWLSLVSLTPLAAQGASASGNLQEQLRACHLARKEGFLRKFSRGKVYFCFYTLTSIDVIWITRKHFPCWLEGIFSFSIIV